MLLRVTLITAALMTCLAGNVVAAAQATDSTKKEDPPPKDRAVINFANFRGSIQDWRAEGNKAILIQDVGRKWYRAEFMAPCTELPFTERVGFITDSLDQIDRFSSILVRGQRCWFKSFTEIEAPTSDKHKAKH
ncbi:DUF6491 family protein [Govanella unica]|uniref:DUF6491 family protein n=1 Tax=Govanella unica TaxID=2975056 RepID=A0A9X3TYW0_9PROT|nr:DUF6491 family protein [Govania unica]MDA5194232.1 DUF6491 family protein [Govania unica]